MSDTKDNLMIEMTNLLEKLKTDAQNLIDARVYCDQKECEDVLMNDFDNVNEMIAKSRRVKTMIDLRPSFTPSPWQMFEDEEKITVHGMASGLRNHKPDKYKRDYVICEINNSLLQAPGNALIIEGAPAMYETLEVIKHSIDELLDGTYDTIQSGLTQQDKINLIGGFARQTLSDLSKKIQQLFLTMNK